MKYSVMKKWVKALRSGKYSQTTDALKYDTGYCCLGVLCAISGLDKFKRATGGRLYTYGGKYGLLPKKVLNFSGMKTDNGQYSNNTGTSCLVDKNDAGLSFKQIANIIERQWRKL